MFQFLNPVLLKERTSQVLNAIIAELNKAKNNFQSIFQPGNKNQMNLHSSDYYYELISLAQTLNDFLQEFLQLKKY